MRYVAPVSFSVLNTDLSDTTNITDEKLNTQVSKTESFYIELDFSNLVDTLALLNLDATEVKIELLEELDVILSLDIDLREEFYEDIWGYFYDDFSFKKELFVGIRLIDSQSVKITVTKNGGDASLGMVVGGMAKFLGQMLVEHSPNFTDYSTKESDETTGVITDIKRGYFSKNLSCSLLIDKDKAGVAYKKVVALRGKKTLFLGEAGEHSVVFGFISRFSPLYENALRVVCDLEIEGLT